MEYLGMRIFLVFTTEEPGSKFLFLLMSVCKNEDKFQKTFKLRFVFTDKTKKKILLSLDFL